MGIGFLDHASLKPTVRPRRANGGEPIFVASGLPAENAYAGMDARSILLTET